MPSLPYCKARTWNLPHQRLALQPSTLSTLPRVHIIEIALWNIFLCAFFCLCCILGEPCAYTVLRCAGFFQVPRNLKMLRILLSLSALRVLNLLIVWQSTGATLAWPNVSRLRPTKSWHLFLRSQLKRCVVTLPNIDKKWIPAGRKTKADASRIMIERDNQRFHCFKCSKPLPVVSSF